MSTNRIRYCHFHRTNLRSELPQFELFATLATVEIAPGAYGIGLAIKSEKDNGSRRTGRTISKERALRASEERLGGVTPRATKTRPSSPYNSLTTRGVWTDSEMRAFIRVTREHPEEIGLWISLAHKGGLQEFLAENAVEYPVDLTPRVRCAEVTSEPSLLA